MPHHTRPLLAAGTDGALVGTMVVELAALEAAAGSAVTPTGCGWSVPAPTTRSQACLRRRERLGEILRVGSG